MNSASLDGLAPIEAIQHAIEAIKKKGIGDCCINMESFATRILVANVKESHFQSIIERV